MESARAAGALRRAEPAGDPGGGAQDPRRPGHLSGSLSHLPGLAERAATAGGEPPGSAGRPQECRRGLVSRGQPPARNAVEAKMNRNPYVILGIPFGSSRARANVAFARKARSLRRAGAAGHDALTDLTWALQQIDEAIRNPAAALELYRIPANP